MPEKNATLVVKLHKCHIFERPPSSISDVAKETLHEGELANKVQGNEKFKLKKLNVDGFGDYVHRILFYPVFDDLSSEFPFLWAMFSFR